MGRGQPPTESADRPWGYAHGCLACGYSLRGLSDDDACPECGVAVADTRYDSPRRREVAAAGVVALAGARASVPLT
jgi:hypothetical protein